MPESVDTGSDMLCFEEVHGMQGGWFSCFVVTLTTLYPGTAHTYANALQSSWRLCQRLCRFHGGAGPDCDPEACDVAIVPGAALTMVWLIANNALLMPRVG